MKRMEQREQVLRRASGFLSAVSVALLAIVVEGCGGNSVSTTSPTTTQKSPQTYLAPLVAGSTSPVVPASNADGAPLHSAQTYMIDDVGGAFSQTSYLLNPPQQNGAQVLNAGAFSTSSRGVLSLGVTAAYYYNTSSGKWASYVPSQSGGFAIQLADQAGGLVQLPGQPVAPLVPTTAACPAIKTAQPYQFITIPGPLIQPSAAKGYSSWDPLSETAFGSVDISTSGTSVNFDNIKQFTLPSVGGSGAPSSPGASSIAGACGQTAYGNTISIPGQVVITNPGGGAAAPQAIAGIGSTGLLVEDNDGYTGVYMNALGAGTGAVGLPKPSSPLDLSGGTSSVTGAQYLGFVYGAGVHNGNGTPTGWSSHLVSFGLSRTSSSCALFAAQTGTLVNGIYGGDFTNDDPTTYPSGNCDFAIDLGNQIASNNSLYTQATVHMGASYRGNATGNYYHFPAVAIAGQLNGKYVIFVLGVDSTQPWAVYLLQSTN